MEDSRLSAQARSKLDRRFQEFGPTSKFAVPVRGWIRAIREALGMSSSQLAQRLGITQPSVSGLEQSEIRGTIELATLRRAAQALDCTLVYAFIPNRPLETIVQERARTVARRHLAPIEHSMLLEDQAVSHLDAEVRLEEFVRGLKPSRLWDEP